MSDAKCRGEEVSKVVSNLTQSFQPRNTAGMVAMFTTNIIVAVKAQVLPTPRRQRQQAWMIRICRKLGYLQHSMDREGTYAATLARPPPG